MKSPSTQAAKKICGKSDSGCLSARGVVSHFPEVGPKGRRLSRFQSPTLHKENTRYSSMVPTRGEWTPVPWCFIVPNVGLTLSDM